MISTKKKISGIISFRLIIAVSAAFVITSLVTYKVLYHDCVTRARDLLSITCLTAQADLEEGIYHSIGEDVVLKELDKYLTQGEEAVADYLKENKYSYFAKKDGTIFLAGDDAFLGKNVMDIQYAPAFIDELYDIAKDAPDFTGMYDTVKTLDGKCDMIYYFATDPSSPDVFLAAAFPEKDFSYERSRKTVNRFVGLTGYTILVNPDGTILNPYVSWDIQGDQFPAADIMEKYDEGTDGDFEDILSETMAGSEIIEDTDRVLYDRAVLWGKDYFLCMTKIGGIYCISLYPAAEALSQADNTIQDIVITDIIIFTVLFIVLIRLVKLTVVDKIKKVNASLDRITNGYLDESVEVRDSCEFDVLSTDINATVDKLKEYIAEAAARIDAELFVAKSIQTSALPSVFPPFPEHREFELYASMQAAKEVGGDFYDFYMLGENTLGFLIADVSGKSIPGAMFMMTAKTVIKSLAESGLSPDEVFTQANEKLCEGNEAEMFVTAWLGYLDLKTGAVRVANAGHNPPILIHDAKAEYVILKPGLMLAEMEEIRYNEQTLQLQKGDILYLYTDGVTEAMDEDEKRYGGDRLKELLSFGDSCPETDTNNGIAGAICDIVSADVAAFAGGAEQSDDITMLCIRYLGQQDGIKDCRR